MSRGRPGATNLTTQSNQTETAEEQLGAPQQRQGRRLRRRLSFTEVLREPRLGRCEGCATALVKGVHITDAIAGMTLITYGGMIASHTDPPIEAFSSVIAFGSLLLLAATTGIVGLSLSIGKRCCLVISAYSAPVIACTEVAIVLLIEISGDAFFDYLKDNKEKLSMDDTTIKRLEHSAPAFYVILLFLACIEVVRYFLLHSLREHLVQRDKVFMQVEPCEGDLGRGILSDEPSDRGESNETGSPAERHKGAHANQQSSGGIFFARFFPRWFQDDGSELNSEDDFVPLDDDLYMDSYWWSRGMGTNVYNLSWHDDPPLQIGGNAIESVTPTPPSPPFDLGGKTN